jgi:hypothetical protein
MLSRLVFPSRLSLRGGDGDGCPLCAGSVLPHALLSQTERWRRLKRAGQARATTKQPFIGESGLCTGSSSRLSQRRLHSLSLTPSRPRVGAHHHESLLLEYNTPPLPPPRRRSTQPSSLPPRTVEHDAMLDENLPSMSHPPRLPSFPLPSHLTSILSLLFETLSRWREAP